MTNRRCPNSVCPAHGRVGGENIVIHGFYRTRSGKRRRYRCRACGRTFSSTTGTPYYRLQHRRARFDAVVALRVEGVNISAIARVEGIAWNTAARWLEKAASVCCAFNRGWTVGFVVRALQADELRAFVGSKTQPAWIFVAIEVWSRLWPATVTGRRSYRNTLALLGNLASHIDLDGVPLIVTDGFGFYEQVVRRVFGSAVLYGQVLKTRRNDRVVRVERRARLGAPWRVAEALTNSEDSSTLNTSFIERLNLTIRQGSALSVSTNAGPCSLGGEARRASRAPAVPLQLRPPAPRAEVRTGRSDTGDAGRTRHSATHVPRGLRVSAAIFISTHRRDRVGGAEPGAKRPWPERASGRLSNS